MTGCSGFVTAGEKTGLGGRFFGVRTLFGAL